MKQYVIDDIRLEDYGKIKDYLGETYGKPDLGGIYWIPLLQELLTDVQAEHKGCHPLVFAVDLSEKRLECEFLVRTKKSMRCDCMGYATLTQRNWLIDYIDTMLEKLGVIT
ncbi:MAG: hypothetical protein B6I31_04945 [Desulfobacteraceae bacterium 4572_19]|nr:MAG: hypothetical protein B6I31_04945 [Desulfobacteraceae bacterium 4572_19]